jgi:hypothetical protein
MNLAKEVLEILPAAARPRSRRSWRRSRARQPKPRARCGRVGRARSRPPGARRSRKPRSARPAAEQARRRGAPRPSRPLPRGDDPAVVVRGRIPLPSGPSSICRRPRPAGRGRRRAPRPSKRRPGRGRPASASKLRSVVELRRPSSKRRCPRPADRAACYEPTSPMLASAAEVAAMAPPADVVAEAAVARRAAPSPRTSTTRPPAGLRPLRRVVGPHRDRARSRRPRRPGEFVSTLPATPVAELRAAISSDAPTQATPESTVKPVPRCPP